jgi:hypothetical protein
MGCFHQWVPIAAGVVVHVIHGDEENIGLFTAVEERCGSESYETKKTCEHGMMVA